MKTESMPAAEIITSSLVMIAGLLVADKVGISFSRPRVSALRKPCLMRAAFGRRDGVAVGIDEAVAAEPGPRPIRPSRGRLHFSLLPEKISAGDLRLLPSEAFR
jgi:hypothetical protein